MRAASPMSDRAKAAPRGIASQKPVDRSSTTVTEWPSRRSSAEHTEPTYPAPPVTNIFAISKLLSLTLSNWQASEQEEFWVEGERDRRESARLATRMQRQLRR